jgi:trigger factor
MREDVVRFGVKYEDYLKQINKTEEELRKEFRDQATKRAKLQLTLNKIAADEKIEIDQAQVEQEMKHALEHFPDAKPELVRIHIETVLRNEKVLQLLEKGEK